MEPQRTSVRDAVGAAYGARAAEYTELLGSVESLAARDRDTISAWGTSVVGPVLDAGCGPGHWTEHLRALGVDATGIDLTPEFVDIAKRRFPAARFRVGALEALPVADAALGGLLSWYSVIHTPPEEVPAILREFARVLRPGGSLLLGCFEGPRLEAFDHAVTTAYFWPVAELRRELERAGFAVRSVRTRTDAGSRPHAEYLAERVGGAAA